MTFFFLDVMSLLLSLATAELVDVNDVLLVSVVVVVVDAAVLSVSVVSMASLSSSALVASSPSPTISERLRSDSGILRKFAKLAVMVARTREKSVVMQSVLLSSYWTHFCDDLWKGTLDLRLDHRKINASVITKAEKFPRLSNHLRISEIK